MRLDEVIRGIAIVDRRGRFSEQVSAIVSDSRKAEAGALFVAVRGIVADGHDYIGDAIERGATAVMAEAWPDEYAGEAYKHIAVVLVPNARRALALAAANFYGHPSKQIHVAGVTGTNGKTTVTYILEAMLSSKKRPVGVIGTVEARYGDTRLETDNTTPGAVTLQRILAEMAEHKVRYAAMEVSSHALDQERVSGVNFKVAAFTNLSQDHLDYHKSLETYFKAKARLFSERLKKSQAQARMAVVNIDDPRGLEMAKAWPGRTLTVTTEPNPEADIEVLEYKLSLEGVKAKIRCSKGIWYITSPMIGLHNLSNLLVAMGMALAMCCPPRRIQRGMERFRGVPGRLERVFYGGTKHVFVDYAHSPAALRATLSALRSLTKGRLLVVFGCGGDRDHDKRGPMGQAVAEFADFCFLTTDNPRREDPAEIAAAVVPGLEQGGLTQQEDPAQRGFTQEPDRAAAIYRAVEAIGEDDVLLIAGKGHETHQLVGADKLPFSDRQVAFQALKGVPPAPPEDDPAEPLREVTQLLGTAEILEEVPVSKGPPPEPEPT